MAYCDHKLFVVDENSDTIDVFGHDNKELPSIKVKGMKQPNDIVMCPDSKQIYIGDSELDCIWRASVDGHHVEKWLPKSTSAKSIKPHSLSLTSKHRLLVTSQKQKTLILFGRSGTEHKRVPLRDMHDLSHAVETSRETFIVSHARCVSEVDANGRLIVAYSGSHQLGKPCYLALNPDGRVLVVDQANHCVLLLNCRLLLKRVLLNGDEHHLAQRPWRLCVDEQSQQLFVASNIEDAGLKSVFVSQGCVQVYTINRHTFQ